MINYAVLLTVHNRKVHTERCLSKLFTASRPVNTNMVVYLTDDGCTDGTRQMITSKFPEVRIVSGNGSLYWNRGMYAAWKQAVEEKDYDFYIWLNDDTYLYSNSLEILFSSTIEKGLESIIIGSTQSEKTKRVTYGGRLNGKLLTPNGDYQEANCMNGNIVLVPASVYKKIGNLDYYFTHSKGDFDYAMRAVKVGIKIYVAPMFLGTCEVHESIDKWCDPTIPFKKRWTWLWRPNGMPPHETFYLEKKHYSLIKATFHYATIILRCILPQLWIRK